MTCRDTTDSAERGDAGRDRHRLLRHKVAAFYERIWNARDHGAIAELLHEDVSFRGSLGDETLGHAAFAAYVDGVHAALGDYRCTIEDLVVEGDRAFARMTFAGIHRGHLMGHPPTRRRVSWSGAALFTFRGSRIADLWVLGDLHALERQLSAS